MYAGGDQTWAWGGGGYGGVYTPPKDLHTSGQNWLGGYGNFFHVVKNFSEKPATFFFFFFCSPQAKFLGVGGGIYPPSRGSLPPPTEKTCPCLGGIYTPKLRKISPSPKFRQKKKAVGFSENFLLRGTNCHTPQPVLAGGMEVLRGGGAVLDLLWYFWY